MSTLLPGNQESAELALDGGLYGLLERRKFIAGIGDPTSKKIKALIHLNGDFTDSRGHTVSTPNTYNYSFIEEGKFGKAVYNKNNGSNGNVNVNIKDIVPTFPAQFTASMWAYDFYAGTYRNDFSVCMDNTNSIADHSGLVIMMAPSSAGKYYIYPKGVYANAIAVSTSARVSNGVWTHLAITYNNGTIKWYINGAKTAEYTGTVSDLVGYSGPNIRFQSIQKGDELMYSEHILITGDSYTVPTAPYK